MGGDGWRMVQVEDLAAQKPNALATGPFGSSISSKFFREQGVPVIRGGNLSQDVTVRVSDTGLAYVSDELGQKFKRSEAVEGDLVFTCWGTINQIGLIDGRAQYRRYIVSNKQMKLTPDKARADSLYLYYYFSSPEGQHQIISQAIGSSVPGFNLGQLRAIRILLPSLPEQKAIAHILGTLDDKIENNRRMNKTLEAMARAIFKSWFVDFDPVRAKAEGRAPDGMDADTSALFPDRFEDSSLGKIPAGWDVGTMRDHCDRVENGGTPRRDTPEYWEPGTIRWLTSGEVRQGIVADTDVRISESGLINSSAKLWPSGTTVVALYGATAGQVCFVTRELSANQACCGLLPPVDSQYFVYILASEATEQLANLSRGSAQQNLSQGLVSEFRCLNPGKKVIRRFNDVAAPIFQKWIGNMVESNHLAATRDALLSKLLSGEVRVKEVEAVVGKAV